MLELSINQSIKVKLTTFGELALQQSLFDLISQKDKWGYYKITLWKFIQIFGNHFYLGAQPIVEGGIIYLEEEEEK